MNNFTCIIVDDEPQAIELLADSLRMLNQNVDIIATYTSWNRALEGLRAQACDIIFMDISVQNRNGMDLLRCIPNLQSEVIFVTAYADHALEAFEFPASGYLVKPLIEADLAKVLDRAISRVMNKRQAPPAERERFTHKIGIPDQKAINYIKTNDIVYLEAVNTYTNVFTSDKTIVSSYNIGKFRQMLDEKIFFQVHRSYIVNLEHVTRYEADGTVILSNGKSLPVAKNAREPFLKLFSLIRPKQ
jgi:two-component system LytT family response regulator